MTITEILARIEEVQFKKDSSVILSDAWTAADNRLQELRKLLRDASKN